MSKRAVLKSFDRNKLLLCEKSDDKNQKNWEIKSEFLFYTFMRFMKGREKNRQ